MRYGVKAALVMWAACWVDLVAGIIGVLTLGLYQPEPIQYRMTQWWFRTCVAYHRRHVHVP